jgi:hypothetical protein
MRLMEELSTLSVPAEYTHSTDEHTGRAPGGPGQQRRQPRVSNVNLRPFAAVHVGSLLGFVPFVCAQPAPHAARRNARAAVGVLSRDRCTGPERIRARLLPVGA